MSSNADALRRLISESISMHEVVAASLGINGTDLRCLELLHDQPDITPSRLAELAALTSGAVTGVLDRLEAAGFVRRESDPEDRRRLIVRPVSERMAQLAAAYGPLLARASEIGAGSDLGRTLEGLAGALAGESDRLRVSTEGGFLGDTYVAPLTDVTRARLHLFTGAPRLNVTRSGFGQQMRMVAETAATRLHLRPARAGSELLRATFVGPPPDVRTNDGSVTMRYRRRVLDTRAREVDAALDLRATWSVEVDGGITDLDGDLRDISFGGLEIHGGANHLRLRLPRPSGTVRIAVVGGSSDVRLKRPAAVPVAVSARGGVAHLRLDDMHRQASGADLRVQTPDYETTPDRYLLELDGSVAKIVIASD